MNRWFNDFATKIAVISGRSYSFVFAVLLILIWAISGPIMHFSNTWQLFINTFTTLVTFMMVFVIQNSQNRSANSTEIKMDLTLHLLGMDDKHVRKLEKLDDKRLEEILKEVQSGRNATDGASFGSTRPKTSKKQR